MFFGLLLYTISAPAKDQVPFRFVDNLLLVKANLNGQVGEFILDTGAPELIVNQAYFKGMPAPWPTTGIVDLNGHAGEVRYFAIEHFTIGELPVKKQYALTVDLSSVERVKGVHLLGIIGYAVLKDLELVFDFDRQELTFAPAHRKSNPLVEEPPAATHNLKLSGHVPYLIATIGKKKFRLGIDTGAEVNLFDGQSLRRTSDCFDKIKKLMVKGISHQQQAADAGVLKNLMIGQKPIGPLDITVVSLYSLNGSLTVDLDGILGMPFLSNGRVGINYKKKKLWFWEQEGQYVENRAAITTEAIVGKQ